MNAHVSTLKEDHYVVMRSDQHELEPLEEPGRIAKHDAYLDVDDSDLHHSPSKKRKSSKALDRRHFCPHDGCGKSYSRAEHLQRHQLNR